MKKLALLLAIGFSLICSTPLVWGQGTGLSAVDYNGILESYGLKLQDPQKCPSTFVTVVGGKNDFGTVPTIYAPVEHNSILEARMG